MPETSPEPAPFMLESPLTRKLSAFVALSDTDLETLARFYQRRRRFRAGHAMIHEGQSNASAFILARGWACSYKMLPDGARQIVDFQIPGDFLGLRSILFRTADHGIEAITRIEASEVVAADIIDAFAHAPRLATAVLWRRRAMRRWWWSIRQSREEVGGGARVAFPPGTERAAEARGHG